MNMPLQVDKLFRDIPTHRMDRWTLLHQLFAGWYGTLNAEDGFLAEDISAAEARLGISLPAALREWCEFAGRRADVWSCQDRFLPPQDMRIENDRLIIQIENQGVVLWSIPLPLCVLADPPVYVSDQQDEKTWIEEVPHVSTFALSQALLGAKFSDYSIFTANAQVTDEALDAVSNTYMRLGLPDLHWPPDPTRLYGAEDLIIETDAETWIWISSRSQAQFSKAVQLMEKNGVKWSQMLNENC